MKAATTAVLWGLALGLSACSVAVPDKPSMVPLAVEVAATGLPAQVSGTAVHGRRATVLILHGCGGVGAHDREWARRLLDWGYNAVVVNSFVGRTQVNVCTQGGVTPMQRAHDVLRVAQWVRQQAWSNGHVAAIGFSHGALGLLMASASSGLGPGAMQALDAAVAFYPLCLSQRTYPFERDVALQIHIGQADDWTPAARCPPLVRRWQLSADYFEYPGAFHGFDRQAVDRVVRGRNGPHVLRSDPDAAGLAIARTRQFLRDHLTR